MVALGEQGRSDAFPGAASMSAAEATLRVWGRPVRVLEEFLKEFSTISEIGANYWRWAICTSSVRSGSIRRSSDCCPTASRPLTPKSFELLRVLVENPGRLLHKEELLKLVWPDSYVEEGNLSHHVFALRKALGDEKGSTQYIETVPRRGYRFIADVQEVKETVAREAPVVRDALADQSRAIARVAPP